MSEHVPEAIHTHTHTHTHTRAHATLSTVCCFTSAVFTAVITCASAGVEVSLTACYEVMKCAFHLETQFSSNNSLVWHLVPLGRNASWLRYHTLDLKLH